MLRAAAWALAVLWIAPPCWAWGREGHRLTALVAEHYLTPEAAAAVKELLGDEPMQDVASWADEVRYAHPETGPWHYVNIPLKAKWRNCVVDRIAYFEQRLGDKRLSHEERCEALKYLIHLVADIQQPFHNVGDARGGNDIAVSFLGSTQCGKYDCELHAVWDSTLIDNAHLSETAYTHLLLTMIREDHLEEGAAGTPEAWSTEAHRLARPAWKRNHAAISEDYVEKETPVVDQQLALGGLRLARVLNTILSGQQVPPFQK
jgi:hypothetical protein